eukprot:48344-Eustigmatos_ZCMA.PRE.1
MSVQEGTSNATARLGATISAGSSMNVSIPLLSFLSLLSGGKAIPLHQGFTIFVSLETAANALFVATSYTAGYTISGVSLSFQTLELDPGLD